MAAVMEIYERVLAAKFETILPHLDERQRRLLLAAEARFRCLLPATKPHTSDTEGGNYTIIPATNTPN